MMMLINDRYNCAIKDVLGYHTAFWNDFDQCRFDSYRWISVCSEINWWECQQFIIWNVNLVQQIVRLLLSLRIFLKIHHFTSGKPDQSAITTKNSESLHDLYDKWLPKTTNICVNVHMKCNNYFPSSLNECGVWCITITFENQVASSSRFWNEKCKWKSTKISKDRNLLKRIKPSSIEFCCCYSHTNKTNSTVIDGSSLG